MIERTIPLRWRDFDAQGHVNHAVFLTLLEIGRDALSVEVFGIAEYAIARVEIDYRSEITQETTEVQVQIAVESVGKSSFTTVERLMLPGGEVAAEATVISVLWNAAAHTSRQISESQRVVLMSHTRH